MGVTNNNSTKRKKETRPSLTPEGRENQIIAMAMDRAEEQIRDGTASSQLITHFLKLGSTKDRVEQEILQMKKELIQAQTEALKSTKRVEELYMDALTAMRNYSGHGDEEENDDY